MLIIDLIGEEFAPKRSQQQQPSVIVETIDSDQPNSNQAVTQVTQHQPVTTMSQPLGPNVVFVNTSGGSGVPLQVQQIIQQAQQQVSFWIASKTLPSSPFSSTRACFSSVMGVANMIFM